ncbi:putative oxidoreductase YjhC [Ceratocystis lukuohia]|uniref:Oxidoreductase YjhC n=3 Tax=Ceratocystis TaxID=5157 RepID=A0ABR4MTQ3_9PEZI|nr:putative oxidoreductase YjhC [Ceratocystis platani]PHH50357.1 putative oxidoreductase YjhC [Ceratocystis fimbriata CBS 114723]
MKEPTSPARFLIIGAGSRGNAYGKGIKDATNGVIAAVAEPDSYKRQRYGQKFIWGYGGTASEGQAFADWKEFIVYENERRKRAARGDANVPPGVDGVFVCVLDEMHREVVVALGPLNLHVMCEKPLATSLQDCIDMYKVLRTSPESGPQRSVFSIGHVLRYSPHNVLLRRLLLEKKVIGDILSVVHTEPVGWWHFTHSYVRGNWRRSDMTGPSLLTKSCHDIDLILWLLSSPVHPGKGRPHLPTTVSSIGKLQHFRKARKPKAAEGATNCTKCALGDEGCMFSAKNVYLGPKLQGVESGNTGWPVKIVLPDIEAYSTMEAKHAAMLTELQKDYAPDTPDEIVRSRNWFGRCVFDGDNNVCDEQVVTIQWEDDQVQEAGADGGNRLAKTATFHMVAQTHKICQRYSNFHGTAGEIHADSRIITVTDFRTGQVTCHEASTEDTGHGGGDIGLSVQFVHAVNSVKNGELSAEDAQLKFMGCTLEEVLRSHAMVFAAEEARLSNKVVDWEKWWGAEVQTLL